MSTGVVHAWLAAGTLPARRSPTGRWAIPFPTEVEEACRARIIHSAHIHRDSDDHDRQPDELSITEVAARLGVQADVVYYWAKRGYVPARRGKAGRRWITLTPALEANCHARIAGSYKLPEDVKTAHHLERAAV